MRIGDGKRWKRSNREEKDENVGRDSNIVCSIKKKKAYDFFFRAEDGIRGARESRGLGDVYKGRLY